MRLARLGTRRPVCIDRDASVAAASRLMREESRGDLVVTERQGGVSVPVGVISARDIVTRVVALGLDPLVLTTGDLLWSPCVTARTTDTIPETLNRLRAADSETLPVVNTDGNLMGVVSLDDLLQALAGSDSSRTNSIHR
jgi:CBS domain-containing protein